MLSSKWNVYVTLLHPKFRSHHRSAVRKKVREREYMTVARRQRWHTAVTHVTSAELGLCAHHQASDNLRVDGRRGA